MGVRAAKRGMAFVLLACVAIWACGEDPVAPELIGWYSMNTLDGATLPAAMPCSSSDSVLHSMLYLGSDRSAGYSFAMQTAAGDIVTFEGTGTFDESASTVVMTLNGSWTGEDRHVVTFTFARNADTLRHTLVGACDAAAVAEYLPALVTDIVR